MLVVVISALFGCGGGGSSSGGAATPEPDAPPPMAPPPVEPPPDTAAKDLASELQGAKFSEILAIAGPAIALRDPQGVLADGLATTYGLTGTSLTNISFEYRSITFDMWQAVRDALNEIEADALTAADRLSYDIYSWLVDGALAQRDFMHFDYQASYFLTSVPRRLQRFFADLHPLETAQDARDYIDRLAAVDDTIEQLIENLQAMENEGVIEPAATLEFSIDVHRDIANTSASNSPYYQGVATRLAGIADLSDTESEDIQFQARDIITREITPAYRDLLNFMSAQLPRAPGDVGVGQFANGEDFYRERLRFHTTTSLSADEIHQLGLQELERIHAEQRLLFDQLGYPQEETLKQLFDRVGEDGGTVLAEDAVATYEAIIDDAQARMSVLFERLPETEVVVIGGANGGVYISASQDGTRPGAFYAGTVNDQPYYLMPTLAYHEAMPGHHMQIALSQELDLPEFRRGLTFTGFTEGWALYAERLAGDYLWYETDIYGDLGRLYYEGVRAARLVVDTGIHSRGWSFDEAAAFFQESVGTSLGSAQSNIGRYTLYPGQATAYMVGMLKILELRERMRDVLGDDFDIMNFHSLVLHSGALPLDILEQQVDAEIAVQTN